MGVGFFFLAQDVLIVQREIMPGFLWIYKLFIRFVNGDFSKRYLVFLFLTHHWAPCCTGTLLLPNFL